MNIIDKIVSNFINNKSLYIGEKITISEHMIQAAMIAEKAKSQKFLDDKDIKMLAVEAAGCGLNSEKHAASLTGGKPGVLHGNKTYLLQSNDGQIKEAHSISAGLDYPGIGPEHSFLFDEKRVQYVSATDEEALKAFQYCCHKEGIIPALEPAHALAALIKIAPKMNSDEIVVMNMCGRGDKDIFTVAKALNINI